MLTTISIIIGLILLYIFKKLLLTSNFIKNNLNIHICITLIIGVSAGISIIFIPILLNTNMNDIEHTFHPLYKIDPKQNGFIIYNINENRYDTISRGQLETYIMNDNL